MYIHALAIALRMPSKYYIHASTVVGKLERKPELTLGFADLLRDYFV